jgi:hypothetical protein
VNKTSRSNPKRRHDSRGSTLADASADDEEDVRSRCEIQQYSGDNEQQQRMRLWHEAL